ncbi:MAG: PQQ-binding-like beta-propeller repeat protein [Kofleriaceae bacterium]
MNLRAGLAAALFVVVGCGVVPPIAGPHDPTRASARPPLGLDLLALRWKHVTADRRSEVRPQEFATPTVAGDTVYAGSYSGGLLALDATTGAVRWRLKTAPISSAPLAYAGLLYVGTDNGRLLCLDAQTGVERWAFATTGAIGQQPQLTGELVIFANEAGEVRALDALTGVSRWQYASSDPMENPLRGHAGVSIAGDLAFTGFADGTMVALRTETGSLAWSASLRGDADKFIDVDATPIVLGEALYVVSSSGGVWSLDRATGRVRWHLPLLDAAAPGATGSGGTIATDGERLFVAAAELGVYALDLAGHVLWRQGTHGGGEPAIPIVAGDLVVYSLAEDGMFLADRRTGELYEYFDPGEGISAAPAITGDGLFVMSNLGVLYAFDLEQP